jgi:serine phosphatase RsbU (regulator of sigma subunit)
MNRDEALLKEKAILLLSREREIVGLRRRHAHVTGWLGVAQGLPELAAATRSPSEFFHALSRRLVALLQFQRVHFFSISLPPPQSPLRQPELVPIAREQSLPPRALTSASERLLEEKVAAFCNEPTDDASRDLSKAIGLQRFMWHWFERVKERPLLVAAGYDAEKAPFYQPFDDDDLIHFKNMGQHLSAILQNVALVRELEEDKATLQRFNDNLEDRVRARTEELATANAELARTVQALEQRDRRLHADLEQARSFQRSMLPSVPGSSRVEFAATYRPLELVGGDVYDAFEMDRGRYRCFLADATGHGVQASLRTIVLKSEYDRVKGSFAEPNDVLKELNRRLTSGYGPEEMLCTASCFDVILTDQGATVRCANCAQPPLLLASGSSVGELYSPGPFLGLVEKIDLSCTDAHIARGTLLLAYSDGLCEQASASGAIFAPASHLVAAASAGGAERALDRLLSLLDEFRGSVAQSDDVTMLAARVL